MFSMISLFWLVWISCSLSCLWYIAMSTFDWTWGLNHTVTAYIAPCHITPAEETHFNSRGVYGTILLTLLKINYTNWSILMTRAWSLIYLNSFYFFGNNSSSNLMITFYHPLFQQSRFMQDETTWPSTLVDSGENLGSFVPAFCA